MLAGVLGQRRRRRANTQPTLEYYPVFTMNDSNSYSDPFIGQTTYIEI